MQCPLRYCPTALQHQGVFLEIQHCFNSCCNFSLRLCNWFSEGFRSDFYVSTRHRQMQIAKGGWTLCEKWAVHSLPFWLFFTPFKRLRLLASMFASPTYILPGSSYSPSVFLINRAIFSAGHHPLFSSWACQEMNIPHTLSSLQHIITLWATWNPQGWGHMCWAVVNPLHTGTGQCSPVGSPQGCPSTHPALGRFNHFKTFSVSVLSPLLSISSWHSSTESCKPVVSVLLGQRICGLMPFSWWHCAVALVSQEDRGTYPL